jgi:hypothetical protein
MHLACSDVLGGDQLPMIFEKSAKDLLQSIN